MKWLLPLAVAMITAMFTSMRRGRARPHLDALVPPLDPASSTTRGVILRMPDGRRMRALR
jgi:hypothetical protein